MEEIKRHKSNGNDYYKKFLETKNKNLQKEYLMNSCVSYGKGIEEIMKFEAELPFEELLLLKPTLFLNIGMANFHLEEFFGCKRCCNAAIVLCNNSNLLLEDLGVNEDMTAFVPLNQPVVSSLLVVILDIDLITICRFQCFIC